MSETVYEMLDKAQREFAIMEGKLATAERERNEARDAEKRAVEQLRDVYTAMYIRLDGSVRPGTVYVDPEGGPMREVREAYIQPVSAAYWDRDPRFLPPSHTRRFRLMGQVAKLYVYGEV